MISLTLILETTLQRLAESRESTLVAVDIPIRSEKAS